MQGQPVVQININYFLYVFTVAHVYKKEERVITRHGIFISFCSAKYDVFMSFWGGGGVKYVLKMPKYGKICDYEIQISRGYISRKTNGLKPLHDRTTSSQQHENRNSVSPYFDHILFSQTVAFVSQHNFVDRKVLATSTLVVGQT